MDDLLRAGVPHDAHQWGWRCGFYPGTGPGDHRSGSASSFDGARAAFERAWQELAPTRTEADYRAWRDERDWTAWRRRMHEEHLPLPTQLMDGRSRCFCGLSITIASTYRHALVHGAVAT